MKKLLLLIITSASLAAMDKDEAFKALAQKLIDQKVQAYRKTVEQEFELLKKRVATHAQSDASNKRVPHELIAQEEYAHLLGHFLAHKQIDPSFSWQEDFSRMMMPCSSRYTLLGFALQCRAIANARVLVEHGADLEEYFNPINRSYSSILYPLPESVRLNNPELVKAILSRKKNLSNTGKRISDFPLTIALEKICSEQDSSEKNKVWEIVQALVAAGSDPFEKAVLHHGVFVSISDGTKTYKFSPARPIDVVIEFNRLFSPKLDDLERFLKTAKPSDACIKAEQANCP